MCAARINVGCVCVCAILYICNLLDELRVLKNELSIVYEIPNPC